MAAQILASLVPGFADAAGIYVLEQLLSDGAPVPTTADTGQEAVVVREAGRPNRDRRPARFRDCFPLR